jgi:hypothetical protein
MRIYDGSPRQDFEEVLRSIGAFLDQRGMREVLLVEAPDGFIVQGLVMEGGTTGTWSEAVGRQVKETLTFLDDDIARFMDEAVARRGAEAGAPPDWSKSGYYEKSFRVLGRWMDSERPHDIFFFEQDGAFVVRLQKVGQAGAHHSLAEFTKDDIEAMITGAPQLRQEDTPEGGRP